MQEQLNSLSYNYNKALAEVSSLTEDKNNLTKLYDQERDLRTSWENRVQPLIEQLVVRDELVAKLRGEVSNLNKRSAVERVSLAQGRRNSFPQTIEVFDIQLETLRTIPNRLEDHLLIMDDITGHNYSPRIFTISGSHQHRFFEGLKNYSGPFSVEQGAGLEVYFEGLGASGETSESSRIRRNIFNNNNNIRFSSNIGNNNPSALEPSRPAAPQDRGFHALW